MPAPEEERRDASRDRRDQERDLAEERFSRESEQFSWDRYTENTANAIAEAEKGRNFWTQPEIAAGMMLDLNTAVFLEQGGRPGWESDALGQFWTETRRRIGEFLDQGPSAVVEELKVEEEELSVLQRGYRLARLQANALTDKAKRGLTKEPDVDNPAEDLQILIGQALDFQAVEAAKEAEARAQQKLVEDLRNNIASVGENRTTLLDEEAGGRLEGNVEAAERFQRAAAGLGEFGWYLHEFTRVCSDIGGLGGLAIEDRIEKLNDGRTAEFCSLPGIKPGLDKVFQTLLRLDVGEADALSGFNRNICAMPDLTVKTRDRFIRALRKQAEEAIRTTGVKGDARFLAEKSVELAFAFHEGFLVSAFCDRVRDKDTLEAKDEVKGRGSVLATTVSPDNEKLFASSDKLTSEAKSGYPSPLNLVLQGFPRELSSDLLHLVRVPKVDDRGDLVLDRDGRTAYENGTAFDFLREGKITLSELFARGRGDSQWVSLLRIFYAARLYKMVAEIPQERIEFLPERRDVARKAIRGFAEYLPALFKAAEKSLLPYYQVRGENELGIAEAMRITINTAIAFWQRAVSSNVFLGGRGDNTEEAGLVKGEKFDVATYFREQTVNDLGIFTQEQFNLFYERVRRGATNKIKGPILLEEVKAKEELYQTLRQRSSKGDYTSVARGAILERDKDFYK